ncbi:hypothetical protein [Actinokineospora diospyrosa]|uniref:Uncharacterized protein n=1 Tax=Actinokineospora diospyrosa TaxID=103728 RepID=A0ABT1IAS1_9PSEU|nr:hypothetical protein [Actinokineospora diospyrosa]MCP2269743.1 hypothetical protein [Actinokineospora diospyrosa]
MIPPELPASAAVLGVLVFLGLLTHWSLATGLGIAICVIGAALGTGPGP